MADSIRVLIADDDPLVRVGLSLVLGAAPEIEIVGEAERVKDLRPAGVKRLEVPAPAC